MTPAAWPSEEENHSQGRSPGEQEDRVALHRDPEVDREHEGVHEHQEQRVQERPEEPEEGAAVARPELPQDERPDQGSVSVQVSEVSYHALSLTAGARVRRDDASRRARPRGSARAGSGSPARERPEPARVPDEHRKVDGANALGDLAHLDRARGAREEPVDDLSDRQRLARRGVVGPAGIASGQQEPVRAHHVADVGEIALRRGGADLEDRRSTPPLDLGNLPGDVAPDEAESLAGPDVVEGADDHQRQPLGADVVPRVELLRGLRQGVGRSGGPAPVFGDRLLGLGHDPVDLARGDQEAGNRVARAGPRRAGTSLRGSSGGRPRAGPTRCRPPTRPPGGTRGPGAWPRSTLPAAPGSVRSQATVVTSFSMAARLSVGAPGRTVPTTSAPSRGRAPRGGFRRSRPCR